MPEAERLIKDIEKITANMARTHGDTLAKRLSAAFVAGYKRPIPGQKQPVIAELQLETIRALTKEQMGYLNEFDRALADHLTAKVRVLVAEGKGYADVRREMKPFIQEVFGPDGAVTIDRTGQTKEIIRVMSDGSLRRVEKTISQPYTASLETYSDMLSRTSVHAAYSRGRAEGYKAQGLAKWRYISVNDERVRPAHLVLNGSVFEYGTAESDMAESILQEVNCRCRQIPFFDDPRLDTPAQVFDQQKEKFNLEFKNGDWGFKESP